MSVKYLSLLIPVLFLSGCSLISEQDSPILSSQSSESSQSSQSSEPSQSSQSVPVQSTQESRDIDVEENSLPEVPERTEEEQIIETYNALPEAVKVYLANTAAQGIVPGTVLDLSDEAIDLEYYFVDDAIIIRNIPSRTSMAATYHYINYDRDSITLNHTLNRNGLSGEFLMVDKQDSNQTISKIDLYKTYLANKQDFDYGIKNVVHSEGVWNGYSQLLEVYESTNQSESSF